MASLTPTAEGQIPFDVSGKACSTYFKVFGDLSSSAPRVVILHGGPGGGHEYLLSFAQLWPQYGLPVIFYDQIGCGASTHLPEKAGDVDFWQVSLFLAELNNLLDHLKLRDGPGFHLLGQSWGGMFGATFAASRPRGLHRLVLASGLASTELCIQSIEGRKNELPLEMRNVLDKCIQDNNFENPPQAAQEASRVFRQTFVCRADPFPEELVQAFKNLNEDQTVYGTM